MTLVLFFCQQYFTKLSERTVAYINVDIAVFGKKLLLHYLSKPDTLSWSNLTWSTWTAEIIGNERFCLVDY